MQNSPVGVAHLGSGFIADYHLEGLRLSGMARVQCVTGRSLDKLHALSQKYAIPNVLTQWRDVLNLPDVQAVVIATPDHLHEEMAIACLKAGKAVMLQKPMAGSVQACQRIVEQSITQNVDLQVSFMHRYFEEFQHAKNLIADGVIGKIHSIRMRNATPGPDWGDWFFDQANVANGVVDQLGVHGIDLLIQLLGPMRDVSARIAIQKPTRLLKNGKMVQVNVPDTVMANYEFKCGTLVQHEMSMIEQQGCDRFRMEIYGDEGTIWLRTERGRLSVWAPKYYGQQWHASSLESNPLGLLHHCDWLSGVLDPKLRRQTALDAIVGMRVVHAIHESATNNSIRVSIGH